MTKKPWEVVDPCPMGDVEEAPVFEAIGRALTEWETLEVECAKLFAVFVSANHKRTYHAPAVRAYGAITSADTRSKMLQFAADAYFARRPAKRGAFQKQCSDLIWEFQQYTARRNEIAHGLVQYLYDYKKGKRKLLGIYLLPSF